MNCKDTQNDYKYCLFCVSLSSDIVLCRYFTCLCPGTHCLIIWPWPNYKMEKHSSRVWCAEFMTDGLNYSGNVFCGQMNPISALFLGGGDRTHITALQDNMSYCILHCWESIGDAQPQTFLIYACDLPGWHHEQKKKKNVVTQLDFCQHKEFTVCSGFVCVGSTGTNRVRSRQREDSWKRMMEEMRITRLCVCQQSFPSSCVGVLSLYFSTAVPCSPVDSSAPHAELRTLRAMLQFVVETLGEQVRTLNTIHHRYLFSVVWQLLECVGHNGQMMLTVSVGVFFPCSSHFGWEMGGQHAKIYSSKIGLYIFVVCCTPQTLYLFLVWDLPGNHKTHHVHYCEFIRLSWWCSWRQTSDSNTGRLNSISYKTTRNDAFFQQHLSKHVWNTLLLWVPTSNGIVLDGKIIQILPVNQMRQIQITSPFI